MSVDRIIYDLDEFEVSYHGLVFEVRKTKDPFGFVVDSPALPDGEMQIEINPDLQIYCDGVEYPSVQEATEAAMSELYGREIDNSTMENDAVRYSARDSYLHHMYRSRYAVETMVDG